MEEKEAAFGDFEEVEDAATGPKKAPQQGYVPTRVRLPRENQRLGVVQQRLGGNRMEVRCTDGKTRNARVPGRFKRSMWLRVNDVVLVEPWEHDELKADVVYKYNPSEANQLKKRGMLNNLANDF